MVLSQPPYKTVHSHSDYHRVNFNAITIPERSGRSPLEGETPKEGWDNDVDGILPIGKSTLWHNWSLPGHGNPREDCGKLWVDKGCLNVEGHGVERSDGVSYKDKAYIKRRPFSCKRAECPICYPKWMSREVHNALRRFHVYSKGYDKPIHVVVSPSQEDIRTLGYDKLRKKAYSVLKNVGMKGGCCIIHPFRKLQAEAEKDSITFLDNTSWYYSQHFHVVGYGWVSKVGEEYQKSGWVVKNLGLRESLGATLYYQLSHAGVYSEEERKSVQTVMSPLTLADKMKLRSFTESVSSEVKRRVSRKKATITWFGKLSYNKLHVEKETKEELCPICSHPLVRVMWIGGVDRPPPIPQEEGEWFVDPDGWV